MIFTHFTQNFCYLCNQDTKNIATFTLAYSLLQFVYNFLYLSFYLIKKISRGKLSMFRRFMYTNISAFRRVVICFLLDSSIAQHLIITKQLIKGIYNKVQNLTIGHFKRHLNRYYHQVYKNLRGKVQSNHKKLFSQLEFSQYKCT